MKKLYTLASTCILVVALALCLSVSLPGAHPPAPSCATAQAQAGPDHDAILEVLMDMKGDINQMIQLVNRHKAATITVGPETVVLDTGQLDQLINKYTTLKTGLAAKYAALP